MSYFLTLRANGKTLKLRFFVIRVCKGKLGHMLKPLVPRFRPDLSVRLRDIAKRTGPRKTETDSSYIGGQFIQHQPFMSTATFARGVGRYSKEKCLIEM